LLGQIGALGILANVCTRVCQGSPFPLRIPEHVVVGAILKPMPVKFRGEVLPEESRCQPLIARCAQAEPDEVKVVGHQNIGRRREFKAVAGVEQQFAKMQLKFIVQPTCGSAFDRMRPQDERLPLVEIPAQPGKRGFGFKGYGDLMRRPAPHGAGYEAPI